MPAVWQNTIIDLTKIHTYEYINKTSPYDEDLILQN